MRQLTAYCVDPDCRCLDKAGVIIASPEDTPPGYELREEKEPAAFAGSREIQSKYLEPA